MADLGFPNYRIRITLGEPSTGVPLVDGTMDLKQLNDLTEIGIDPFGMMLSALIRETEKYSDDDNGKTDEIGS